MAGAFIFALHGDAAFGTAGRRHGAEIGGRSEYDAGCETLPSCLPPYPPLLTLPHHITL